MKLKNNILIILLSISCHLFSQDMKEGFNYLETGKYKKAETFFKVILKKFPNNKTAKLCYGRAIGLNGNSLKAIEIFTELLNDYPSDFEIKLNYAESLLWNKQYEKAEKYYEKLIQENAKSFPALLGYANTLSNLKEFKKALIFVNKALDILPGNANALISKKYIRLGLANNLVNKQNYTDAVKILNKNLIDFKDDKETLLNLANVYLISKQIPKAINVYTIISEKHNKLTGLNGIALAKHIDGKEKQAHIESIKAKNLLSKETKKEIIKQTEERYVQALIWNKKFSKANEEIKKLIQKYALKNWVLSLRATLNIYKSNFNESIKDYNKILETNKSSFDGNLGKANALKALHYYNEAYKSADNTLRFYKNQKDATNFIKNLDKQFTPNLETNFSYSFDNGDNIANSFLVNIQVPLSTKLSILSSFNFRSTSNSLTTINAKSNSYLAGLSYRFFNFLELQSILGVTNTKAVNNNFNQFLADISFKITPFKLQNLEIGYKREIQNFNAELLDREIVQNNFIVNYNLNTNFNLGWFTQYYYTTQNDSNTRNLLFTSLYYNILEKPSLKAGINYQNISFKNQVPTIYFSPSKFNAVELFFNLIKNETTSKQQTWFYDLTAATGYQFIENNKRQTTYRLQGKLGYVFSERSFINIYGAQSNIASATAAGFTFTEFGIRFKYLFLRKPIFKK